MCVNPNERRHLWLRYDVAGLGHSTELWWLHCSPLLINPRRTSPDFLSPRAALTRPRSLSTIHTSHFSGHLAPFISVLISLMSHSSNNEEKIRLLHKQEAHLIAQLQKVRARIEECSDSTLARSDNCLGK